MPSLLVRIVSVLKVVVGTSFDQHVLAEGMQVQVQRTQPVVDVPLRKPNTLPSCAGGMCSLATCSCELFTNVL
jgi:hypothetical protein